MTIMELVLLIMLLETMDMSGIGTLLGAGFAQVAKVIVGFGVSIMSIFGIIFGLYLPTRRHRIFRDTQVHILKYIGVLGLYQILCLFITNAVGATGIQESMGPNLMNVLLMTFSLIALMMPFNFVKSLFGVLKAVEIRDPKTLMRQFYR